MTKIIRYREGYEPNHAQECLCNRRPISTGLEVDKDGDYVEYEDYQKLGQEIKDLREQVEQAEKDAFIAESKAYNETEDAILRLEDEVKRLTELNKELQEQCLDYQFDLCVSTGLAPNGNHTYECKKGLWSVESPDDIYGTQEAFHYFNQYKSDGEYHDIIGGITPVEALKSKLNKESK